MRAPNDVFLQFVITRIKINEKWMKKETKLLPEDEVIRLDAIETDPHSQNVILTLEFESRLAAPAASELPASYLSEVPVRGSCAR